MYRYSSDVYHWHGDRAEKREVMGTPPTPPARPPRDTSVDPRLIYQTHKAIRTVEDDWAYYVNRTPLHAIARWFADFWRASISFFVQIAQTEPDFIGRHNTALLALMKSIETEIEQFPALAQASAILHEASAQRGHTPVELTFDVLCKLTDSQGRPLFTVIGADMPSLDEVAAKLEELGLAVYRNIFGRYYLDKLPVEVARSSSYTPLIDDDPYQECDERITDDEALLKAQRSRLPISLYTGQLYDPECAIQTDLKLSMRYYR